MNFDLNLCSLLNDDIDSFLLIVWGLEEVLILTLHLYWVYSALK